MSGIGSFFAVGALDIGKSIGAGAVAAGGDIVLFKGSMNASLKDGAVLAGSDALAQFVDLGSYIPLPGNIGHLANSIATGITYSAINNYAMTTPTSPFKNLAGAAIYGTLCCLVSEAVVDPLVNNL